MVIALWQQPKAEPYKKEMSVVNICLGAFIEKGGTDVTQMLYETMKKELTDVGVDIGRFDLFTNKEQVTEAVRSNRYDVVVCQESLNGQQLGGGVYRTWKELNPRVKIIFIMGQKKKGGRKLEALYNSANYYDALFDTDITGESLKSLMEKSRSREEAFVYYGLSGTVDSAAVVPTQQAQEKAKESAPKEAEHRAPAAEQKPKQKTEQKQERKPEERKPQEASPDAGAEYDDAAFSDALSDMEKYFSNEMDASATKKDTLLDDDVDMQEENFFASEAVFQNTRANHVKEDAETNEKVVEDYVKEEQEFFAKPLPGNRAGTGVSVVPSFTYRAKSTSVKGLIQEVIDEQLIMVTIADSAAVDMLESVYFTLIVQLGKRGFVEGGRYKAGALSFKAYGNCFVDEDTMILEVSDKNMLEVAEDITGKECNLVIRDL